MSVQDYKPMEKAPLDGTVVLVLAGSRKPRAAYWDSKDSKWCYWHATKEPCNPAYWTALPADPPSDYMPEIKTLEDEEIFNREIAHGLAMEEIKEAGISKAPAEKPKGKTKAENENIDKVIKAKEQEEKQKDEFPKNAPYYAKKAEEGKAPYIPKSEAPKKK